MAFTFNPFTGNFDVVIKDGFLPYEYVAADTIVRIPQYRQMTLVDEIVVAGELVVDGSLAIISQTIDDSASLNTYVGENIQDILDRMYGASESSLFNYNGDGTINYVEYYSSSTQTTANRIYRIDMTYSGGNPATETHKHYSTSDGTTVLKTIVLTYNFTGSELTSMTQVTS